MDTYNKLWDKILIDLDGDDIVLEIKIFDTVVDDWKIMIDVLKKNFSDSIRFVNFNLDTHLSDSVFEDSINNNLKSIIVDLEGVSCIFTIIEADEIEFFTSSVVNLDYNQINQLFSLSEKISNELNKELYIYCEAYPKPSVKYFKENGWTLLND